MTDEIKRRKAVNDFLRNETRKQLRREEIMEMVDVLADKRPDLLEVLFHKMQSQNLKEVKPN